MKIKTVILGTECWDKATRCLGTVTHWICDMEHTLLYMFQPKGINPETGQPVERLFLRRARLEFTSGLDCEEYVDIPVQILGTQVADKASGFTGTAVSLIRHPNGCFHVNIQPEGVLPKTNTPIRPTDFDLRQCEGPQIPTWSKDKLDEDKEKHPSPTGDRFDDHVPSVGFDLPA